MLTYTKLLFAIKTLERAGDHIGNIAEEIHYIVTGEHIDLKPNNKENNLEGALEDSNKWQLYFLLKMKKRWYHF